MIERMQRGWEMLGASLDVLKRNPKLMLLPMASVFVAAAVAIVCFLITREAAVHAAAWQDNAAFYAPPQRVTIIGLLFLSYLSIASVFAFFNSALIFCCMQCFVGEPPRLRDGLMHSIKSLPAILAWAAFAATVGVALHAARQFLGRQLGVIAASLMGLTECAWAAATYFALPSVVALGVGPVEAIRHSTKIIRKTWGETLGFESGMGLFTLIVAIPLSMAVTLAMTMLPASPGNSVWSSSGFILIAATMGPAVIVYTTIDGIFRTGAFIYASTGEVLSSISPAHYETVFGIDRRHTAFCAMREPKAAIDFSGIIFVTVMTLAATALIALSPVLLCNGGGAGGNCGEGMMASLPIALLAMPFIALAMARFCR